MLAEIRLERIVACLVVLGIAGAIGIGPSKAEAQMLTATMAVRFAAADEGGHTTDMDVACFDGKTYLAVLEQRTTSCFPWIPVRPVVPDGGFVPVPPRTTSSASGDAEPSGWTPGYRHITVLRLIDVTADPWAELCSIELHDAVAVGFIELADGQLLVAVLAVNDLDKLVFYDLNGAKVTETPLPDQVDDLGVPQYKDFAVGYIGGEPVITVVGGVGYNDTEAGWVVGIVHDSATGEFLVSCTKVVREAAGEFIKVDAVEDYAAMISQSAICTVAWTSSSKYIWRGFDVYSVGTGTELLDVAVAPRDHSDGLAVGPTYFAFALANEETPEGGTNALLYYWKVDEFSPPAPVDTGPVWFAEPAEPGGNAEGTCLCAGRGADIWGSSDQFHYVYAAGNTDGPILGGPRPLGGSDVWFAALEFDPIYTGLPSMRPQIELYGGAGDDTVGAMAAGRPSDAVKKKASRCVYLAVNTNSLYPIDVGNFTLQAVGGIGTDPTIVELKTPAAMIADLIAKVESMNLHQGIDNSLDAKLENARKSLESVNAGNRQDAVNKLQAFINECVAQTGQKLTVDEASALIFDADAIIQALQ